MAVLYCGSWESDIDNMYCDLITFNDCSFGNPDWDDYCGGAIVAAAGFQLPRGNFDYI